MKGLSLKLISVQLLLLMFLSISAFSQEINTNDSTLVSLTIQELAKYDGKNGNPAYVAVDGVIYDVTGVDAWKKGSHGGMSVGTDISEQIKKSPHGSAILEKRKIVGKITATTAQVSELKGDNQQSAVKEFTIEELAKFNGKNGNPAYIAIDGLVYDLTGVKSWKSGKHHGVSAGTDASDRINRSPHKKSVLKKLTVIGKLKSTTGTK